MDAIRIKAHAKINLGLDVVRKLENGYHEVKMIMQTLSVGDMLYIRRNREAGDITLTVEGSDVLADESNLAWKAASLLKEHCGIVDGVSIHLQKRLPVAAGLAGGSADAAAVLKVMNMMFELGLSQEEMMALGAGLGADVPFCVMGGAALAEGIGEKLTPLPTLEGYLVLLATPEISVSTKEVYEQLNLSAIEKRPDIDGMAQAIRRGSLADVLPCMENVLESVTEKKYPIIREIKESLEENGAKKALMSGSGPTVYGIFEDIETAKAAGVKLAKANLTHNISISPVYGK